MTIPRIFIPADVPSTMYDVYSDNMKAITRETNNIFLFSCDQKIEHLNEDFFGETITPEALYPDHIFTIASQGEIGAMVLPFGLFTRYASLFPDINYIVKLTDKTNVMPLAAKDPLSPLLWTIEDVVQCKQETHLLIRGVEVTLYVGSEYEEQMLSYATQTIQKAHAHGLIAILSIHAKGKEVSEEKRNSLVAGICGLANALGADIVKIRQEMPINVGNKNAEMLRIATAAAGNTLVVYDDIQRQEIKATLEQCILCMQNNVRGYSAGIIIFQKPLAQALAITYALSALIYNAATIEKASSIYEQKLANYLQQMYS